MWIPVAEDAGNGDANRMSEMPTTPPPRRRWFQFSLRTFLVLMLLASHGLGWLGTAIQRGRVRRNAVLAIIELGGHIEYHEPSNFLQRSDWLRKSLGDELLLDVEVVILVIEKVSDADLVHLKGLTQLHSLNLRNTQVSDAGLVHLKGLAQLRDLYLYNTQVSYEGVGELQKALPNCQIGWSQNRPSESQEK